MVGRPRTYSDEVRADIQRMFREGATRRQMKAKHGVTKTTVTTILAEAGLASVRRRISPQTKAAVVRDYRRGYSLEELATMHDASKSACSMILEAAGVQKRPGGWVRGGRDRLKMGLLPRQPQA